MKKLGNLDPYIERMNAADPELQGQESKQNHFVRERNGKPESPQGFWQKFNQAKDRILKTTTVAGLKRLPPNRRDLAYNRVFQNPGYEEAYIAILDPQKDKDELDTLENRSIKSIQKLSKTFLDPNRNTESSLEINERLEQIDQRLQFLKKIGDKSESEKDKLEYKDLLKNTIYIALNQSDASQLSSELTNSIIKTSLELADISDCDPYEGWENQLDDLDKRTLFNSLYIHSSESRKAKLIEYFGDLNRLTIKKDLDLTIDILKLLPEKKSAKENPQATFAIAIAEKIEGTPYPKDVTFLGRDYMTQISSLFEDDLQTQKTIIEKISPYSLVSVNDGDSNAYWSAINEITDNQELQRYIVSRTGLDAKSQFPNEMKQRVIGWLEDPAISRDFDSRVIRMWVAQGLLSPSEVKEYSTREVSKMIQKNGNLFDILDYAHTFDFDLTEYADALNTRIVAMYESGEMFSELKKLVSETGFKVVLSEEEFDDDAKVHEDYTKETWTPTQTLIDLFQNNLDANNSEYIRQALNTLYQKPDNTPLEYYRDIKIGGFSVIDRIWGLMQRRDIIDQDPQAHAYSVSNSDLSLSEKREAIKDIEAKPPAITILLKNKAGDELLVDYNELAEIDPSYQIYGFTVADQGLGYEETLSTFFAPTKANDFFSKGRFGQGEKLVLLHLVKNRIKVKKSSLAQDLNSSESIYWEGEPYLDENKNLKFKGKKRRFLGLEPDMISAGTQTAVEFLPDSDQEMVDYFRSILDTRQGEGISQFILDYRIPPAELVFGSSEPSADGQHLHSIVKGEGGKIFLKNLAVTEGLDSGLDLFFSYNLYNNSLVGRDRKQVKELVVRPIIAKLLASVTDEATLEAYYGLLTETRNSPTSEDSSPIPRYLEADASFIIKFSEYLNELGRETKDYHFQVLKKVLQVPETVKNYVIVDTQEIADQIYAKADRSDVFVIVHENNLLQNLFKEIIPEQMRSYSYLYLRDEDTSTDSREVVSKEKENQLNQVLSSSLDRLGVITGNIKQSDNQAQKTQNYYHELKNTSNLDGFRVWSNSSGGFTTELSKDLLALSEQELAEFFALPENMFLMDLQMLALQMGESPDSINYSQIQFMIQNFLDESMAELGISFEFTPEDFNLPKEKLFEADTKFEEQLESDTTWAVYQAYVQDLASANSYEEYKQIIKQINQLVAQDKHGVLSKHIGYCPIRNRHVFDESSGFHVLDIQMLKVEEHYKSGLDLFEIPTQKLERQLSGREVYLVGVGESSRLIIPLDKHNPHVLMQVDKSKKYAIQDRLPQKHISDWFKYPYHDGLETLFSELDDLNPDLTVIQASSYIDGNLLVIPIGTSDQKDLSKRIEEVFERVSLENPSTSHLEEKNRGKAIISTSTDIMYGENTAFEDPLRIFGDVLQNHLDAGNVTVVFQVKLADGTVSPDWLTKSDLLTSQHQGSQIIGIKVEDDGDGYPTQGFAGFGNSSKSKNDRGGYGEGLKMLASSCVRHGMGLELASRDWQAKAGIQQESKITGGSSNIFKRLIYSMSWQDTSRVGSSTVISLTQEQLNQTNLPPVWQDWLKVVDPRNQDQNGYGGLERYVRSLRDGETEKVIKIGSVSFLLNDPKTFVKGLVVPEHESIFASLGIGIDIDHNIINSQERDSLDSYKFDLFIKEAFKQATPDLVVPLLENFEDLNDNQKNTVSSWIDKAPPESLRLAYNQLYGKRKLNVVNIADSQIQQLSLKLPHEQPPPKQTQLEKYLWNLIKNQPDIQENSLVHLPGQLTKAMFKAQVPNQFGTKLSSFSEKLELDSDQQLKLRLMVEQVAQAMHGQLQVLLEKPETKALLFNLMARDKDTSDIQNWRERPAESPETQLQEAIDYLGKIAKGLIPLEISIQPDNEEAYGYTSGRNNITYSRAVFESLHKIVATTTHELLHMAFLKYDYNPAFVGLLMAMNPKFGELYMRDKTN